MKRLEMLNLLHWILFFVGAGLISIPLFLELMNIEIDKVVIIIGMIPMFISGYVKRMQVEEKEK